MPQTKSQDNLTLNQIFRQQLLTLARTKRHAEALQPLDLSIEITSPSVVISLVSTCHLGGKNITFRPHNNCQLLCAQKMTVSISVIAPDGSIAAREPLQLFTPPPSTMSNR